MPDTPLIILAILLMAVGIIGAVVPLIPGPPLIWVGAFLWAWADDFQRVGWVTLILLALIAVVAMASDLLATALTGIKAGMSWRTIAAAIVGGFVGGLLLSVVPVLGTLLGAVLGAVSGVVLVEYLQRRDWPLAWQAAKVYLVGFVLGRIFELVLCVLMVVVFMVAMFQ